MALFGLKKEKKEDTSVAVVEEQAVTSPVVANKRVERAGAAVVAPKMSPRVRPRITEKAALLTDLRVYTFDVTPDANKRDIARAVTAQYKVVPARVHVSKIASKRVVRRGHVGVKSGGKKAYVYLKKGDTIEII